VTCNEEDTDDLSSMYPFPDLAYLSASHITCLSLCHVSWSHHTPTRFFQQHLPV